MSRAEKRRTNRELGRKRADSKQGQRPAIRGVPQIHVDLEDHRPVVRLPFGLQIVRKKLVTPEKGE